MVPIGLRRWFVAHFLADIASAIPLFVAPEFVLGLLGWPVVDPIATRLVAAALFGIGIESYLGRNAGIEQFRGMLNLKVIWSATAAIGLLWSQLAGGPPAGWGVLGIFVVFNVIWVRYRLLLRESAVECPVSVKDRQSLFGCDLTVGWRAPDDPSSRS